MRLRQWWRRTFPIALSLALLVSMMPACGRQSKSEEPENETEGGGQKRSADTVELIEPTQEQLGLKYTRVERRKLTRDIRLSGVVEPNARKMAGVRPLTRGRLESVRVTVGDKVARGQVLAVYDDIELGDLVSQRATAQAALKRASSEAAVRLEALERARRLVESGAMAQAEKQRREADYEQARSGIEEAQAELFQVDQKIRRLGAEPEDLGRRSKEGGISRGSLLLTAVEAPFAGIITEAKAAEGELVGPDTPLFQIADISTVWVQGKLHEKDIGLIQQGQRATVKVEGYQPRAFVGRITYISDFLDEASRTAQVRCEVPNPGHALKLGMFATVDVSLPEGTAVLAVPASAVQQIDSQPVVFVREPSNVFRKRNVQPGRRGENWVEVLKGVSEGEEVVSDGSFQLKAIFLRGSLAEEE